MTIHSRRIACLMLLTCTVAQAAGARDKVQSLSSEVGTALSGKSLGVTRRALPPTFMAMTAGKAAFALLGTAAMAADGKQIVADNEIRDPADIIQAALVPALVQKYGLVLKNEGASAITPGNDPKEILGAQPGSDVVLDLRSVGWQFGYAPTHWGAYWVAYGVEVRMVDASTGKLIAYQGCGGNTQKHEVRPTKDDLLLDKAQLLKDTLGYLGWNCAQQLAKDGFQIEPELLATRPEQFVDPLVQYASKHPASAPATVNTAAPQR